MPRMTAKYSQALASLRHFNASYALPAEQRIVVDWHNQEELYQALQEKGFYWDSAAKVWEQHDEADADDPTKLVMIRVWADVEIVEEVADDLIRRTKPMFDLVERSSAYRCRPPKQLEARIYLKFLPKSKGGK